MITAILRLTKFGANKITGLIDVKIWSQLN